MDGIFYFDNHYSKIEEITKGKTITNFEISSSMIVITLDDDSVITAKHTDYDGFDIIAENTK